MSALIEVLVTSDSEGGQWTCSVWDPRTGTTIINYTGGGAAALHTLCRLGEKFIVTANSTKPLLHVWPSNSQEQLSGSRFVVPGKVTALAITTDGHFLVAGIQETLYVWQICSGKMLNAVSKHFQTITTIKFTDDDSHFITAGQDGAIMIWNLTKVSSGSQQPLHCLNDHSLPVSDVEIGHGGLRTILCSVSLDRSARIYDLVTGNLLLNLVFHEALTAIRLNKLETEIFVGTISGKIYNFNLSNPPRMREYHLESDNYENMFIGHNDKPVTCLDISLDNNLLASGGQDNNVYIWDISTKQLLRTFPHKGSITNIKFMLSGKNTFNPELTFSLIASNLGRMKNNPDSQKDDIIEISVQETESDGDSYEKYNIINSNELSMRNLLPDHSEEIKRLKAENERLKKINKELYNFTVNKLMCSKD